MRAENTAVIRKNILIPLELIRWGMAGGFWDGWGLLLQPLGSYDSYPIRVEERTIGFWVLEVAS